MLGNLEALTLTISICAGVKQKVFGKFRKTFASSHIIWQNFDNA